jgi:hypothetical protein
VIARGTAARLGKVCAAAFADLLTTLPSAAVLFGRPSHQVAVYWAGPALTQPSSYRSRAPDVVWITGAAPK